MNPSRPVVKRARTLFAAGAALLFGVLAVASPVGASSPVVVSVSCSPSAVGPGEVTYCDVTVTPPTAQASAPTGDVQVQAFGGYLTPTTCTLGAYQPFPRTTGPDHCLVAYAPNGAGSSSRKDTLTAFYQGDDTYGPASGTGTVAVGTKYTSRVTMDCDTPVLETNAAECRFYVWTQMSSQSTYNPGRPTGKLTLVASPTSSGVFNPGSCTLTQGDYPNQSVCYSRYLPKGDGTDNRADALVATYAGDTKFLAGTGYGSVGVRPRPVPIINPLCTHSGRRLGSGESDSCTFFTFQNGATNQPTGTIKGGVATTPKGTWTPTSCTISQGVCTASYKPSASGSFPRDDDLTYTYSGDAHWRPWTNDSAATFIPKITTTSGVSCPFNDPNPDNHPAGQPIDCLFFILPTYSVNYDPYASPVFATGTVTFSRVGTSMLTANGSFDTKTCTLRRGNLLFNDVSYCDVHYTPGGTASRNDTIKAVYSGDGLFKTDTSTYAVHIN